MVAPFPPRKGGVTVQTALLTGYLAKSGVEVLRVDTNLQWLRRRGLGPIRLALQPWVVLFRMLGNIPKCDVAHFQAASFWAFMPTFLGVPIARLFGKRSVVSYQGGGGPEFIDRCRWVATMPMRKCTVLTVCSRLLQREFAARGIAAQLHHNLFEAERFKFRERPSVEPKICWTRSLDEIYDPLSALKTFELVRERYPNATLSMTSNGPLMQSLKDYIAGHDLTGATLTGRLPSEDIARLMVDSDICLNTSTNDGLPTALLEAAATGLPIVTTDVGGIGSLFEDGVSAIFVKPGDYRAMAESICDLLEHPEKASAMGVAAREVADQYSWSRTKPEFAEFYGIPGGMPDGTPEGTPTELTPSPLRRGLG